MFDRWLVVTDMDGTLLNHHDYHFDIALPMLRRLEQMDIPVIFNTSKTFAELKLLVKKLDNRHPFIMENGSAIAVPEDYFTHAQARENLAASRSVSGYSILVTGIEIDSIHSFLENTRPDAINFTRCTLEQAMELTGLKPCEARDAQDRQYSVPLYFSDNSHESGFIQQAQQAGFSLLRGGRFLHVQGACNKASSMQILREMYQQQYQQSFGIIALGDSHNDQDMLEQSDLAIVVNSPSSDDFTLQRSGAIYTKQTAPEGWVEGLEQAFKVQKNAE